jgi:hypothetical protein
MLRSLHELERLERYQQEVQSLEQSLVRSQERLEVLRRGTQALTVGQSTDTPLEVLKPLDIIDDREEREDGWQEGDRR